jgi:2,5-dioxopentanoate dehydrogenase
MTITPTQIIGNALPFSNGTPFQAYNPATGAALPTVFNDATPADIEKAVDVAYQAFSIYRKVSDVQKSAFLEAIATNIEALGDDFLQIIHQETGLPLPRLTGERGRTTGQLRLFAQLLRGGDWNKPIIDAALPDRQPAPRPELRQIQVPIGVVAVFGASNFPLAFSVAGGDTASALAAGCPVVFKAHPAHPATCQLVGEAIAKAAAETGMPDGVFSMLHGISHAVGGVLVKAPSVKAVAFTGSFKGGKALYDLAVRRAEPIPVYAEMGSVNPVFFLPECVKLGGNVLANQFAASVTMGSGQFCTNPGVCVFIESADSQAFIQTMAQTMAQTSLHPMLTKGIAEAYKNGIEKQKNLENAQAISPKTEGHISPNVLVTTAKTVIKNPAFLEEVFGPSTVAIMAKDINEMYQLINVLPGQLTATVQAAEAEYPIAEALIELLTDKAGRILLNNFPTGVEVSAAMVHGGPFPATTFSGSTSVGTTAIYRFTRPVCFQNMPAFFKF